MYRYPEDFFRPNIPRPSRRIPIWSAPDDEIKAQHRADGRSPRPERATPPPANGRRPARIEQVFEKPVKAAATEQQQTPTPVATEAIVQPASPVEALDWKTKALQLQAEMENYRKRQQRRADEAIAAERERLLTRFLAVADNLERALAHQDEPEESLYQGVELTQRELRRILEAEGLIRLETVGRRFDPHLHEALATIPAEAEPDMIVEEIEAGYTIGDKLLRPARVVVAT